MVATVIIPHGGHTLTIALGQQALACEPLQDIQTLLLAYVTAGHDFERAKGGGNAAHDFFHGVIGQQIVNIELLRVTAHK